MFAIIMSLNFKLTGTPLRAFLHLDGPRQKKQAELYCTHQFQHVLTVFYSKNSRRFALKPVSSMPSVDVM